MNEKFFDLAREKQNRMINGAIEVFAKNGYKHAATDEMVKAVGVSKGLWFHYFGSKEGIYVFTYDYCVKYMLLEISALVDESEKDYFELIRRIEQAYIRAGRNYPYMREFLKTAEYESEESVVEKTSEARKLYKERMDGFMKDAVVGNISDKARRERIKKMTEYTIDGIISEKQRSGADPDAVYREVKNYIELMRDMVNGLPPQKENEPTFML